MTTNAEKIMERHYEELDASAEIARRAKIYMVKHDVKDYNKAVEAIRTLDELENDGKLFKKYAGQDQEPTRLTGEHENMTFKQASDKIFELTKARQKKTEETFEVAQEVIFAEEPELARVYAMG